MKQLFLTLFLIGCSSQQVQLQKSQYPVLIDTDPALGYKKDDRPRDVDDGLAIVEMLNSKANVLGIGTVFGNTHAVVGERVAKNLVTLKRSPVKVYRGAKDRLRGDSRPLNPAVIFYRDVLRTQKVSIIALGPLTNIAILIERYPKLKSNIEKIIAVMGRTKGREFYIEEHGPVRDFNFVKDIEAAKIVANSGVKLILVPFELSVEVSLDKDNFEELKSKKTPLSTYLWKETQEWVDFWKENFPGDDGIHPWDSAAVSAYLRPDSVECEYRGFGFREVESSAHGVGNPKTGKEEGTTIWFELDKEFMGPKLIFCYELNESSASFIENLMERVY